MTAASRTGEDGAKPVRPGEELDPEKLAAFLRSHLPEGTLAGPLQILQFPGGHSNLTYLVKAGDRELVLRRPPFGNRVKSAHDMGREFRILSKLCPSYPAAPRPVAYSDDESVLGAPFYLMERVRGVVLRRTVPQGITLDAPTLRRVCESLVDALVGLHAVDYTAAGLADLGKPAKYIERQVAGWTKRYRDAQTDEVPELDRIAAWLAARTDEAEADPTGTVRAAIVHNDYKFDNVVLDPEDIVRVRGVLDWEMSTLGDPLMDLGTTLSYWIEEGDPDELKWLAFGPTVLPGALTRREVADRYFDKSGRAPRDLRFFLVFALFKNAGVLQQIYWRYKQGLTKDERFASFNVAVKLLAQRAEVALNEGV
ncbi:phosphotransferase family protein [Pendulispora albinea]|uniref:Phosphotransferase family protein n=1 Tax=Pendulispora albinea TaxID=2741071 RepID=A0ABZ2LQ58_9BACT